MGIVINATVIIIGGILGSIFKTKLSFERSAIFGICVMLISAVGVIENLFLIDGDGISAELLYVVVAALAVGELVGEKLKLDERLSELSSSSKSHMNGFIDSTVFFAVGGLQICGSILLATRGDSSQLYLKSVIDFPFAMMFGAVYGKSVALSALPVAAVQAIIATVAYFLGEFISDTMISQLNSVGYMILFFSGFNMVCDPKYKIKNINMIPAILVIIAYNIIAGIWSAV